MFLLASPPPMRVRSHTHRSRHLLKTTLFHPDRRPSERHRRPFLPPSHGKTDRLSHETRTGPLHRDQVHAGPVYGVSTVRHRGFLALPEPSHDSKTITRVWRRATGSISAWSDPSSEVRQRSILRDRKSTRLN